MSKQAAPKRKPIVEVLWNDSATRHGWQKPDVAKNEHCVCRSVGYLWHEDPETITLIESYDTDDDNIGCATSIPKNCIISSRQIRGAGNYPKKARPEKLSGKGRS